MKRRKISYEYWARIRHYKKFHWGEALFTFHYLEKVSNSIYKVTARMYLWAYILFFIPDLIFMFFGCLWDGGLKQFEWPDRYTTSSYIYNDSDAYDVCEVLWDAP